MPPSGSEVIRPSRLGDRRGPVDHAAIVVVTMAQDEGTPCLCEGVLRAIRYLLQ